MTDGRTWTVQQVVDAEACYTRKRIKELWAGREALTLREVCALDIPAVDRVWLIAQDAPAGWVERIVARAVETHALRCGIPDVEAWAQRWLDGADRSAVTAWAARSAASGAKHWAASSTAEAAWAAWEAAEPEVAAWEAADALEAAERERQVADCLACLDEGAA